VSAPRLCSLEHAWRQERRINTNRDRECVCGVHQNRWRHSGMATVWHTLAHTPSHQRVIRAGAQREGAARAQGACVISGGRGMACHFWGLSRAMRQMAKVQDMRTTSNKAWRGLISLFLLLSAHEHTIESRGERQSGTGSLEWRSGDRGGGDRVCGVCVGIRKRKVYEDRVVTSERGLGWRTATDSSAQAHRIACHGNALRCTTS
jgi:hypothetical protein